MEQTFALNAKALGKKLRALTSLRFFAAAVIILLHSDGSFGIDGSILKYVPTSHGVSFFFVLSGFILTYVYRKRLWNDRANLCRFFAARLARVWPLHILTFLLVIVLLPDYLRTSLSLNSLGLALSNIFMVQAWMPLSTYFFSFNAPSWSIATEFGFYLFFPLLIYRLNSTWHIKLIFTAAMSALIVMGCNCYDLPPGWGGGLGYIGLVNIFPPARFFEFTVGAVAALLYMEKAAVYNPGERVATVNEIIVFVMVILILGFSEQVSLRAQPWVGAAGAQWLNSGGLSCMFFALLILVMALEKGLIARFLSLPLFVLLGEISFAMYLLHQILIRYYRWKIEGLFAVSNLLAYAYFWIILLLASFLIWVLFERPCRKYIVDLSGRLLSRKAGDDKGTSGLWLQPGHIAFEIWAKAKKSYAVAAFLCLFLLLTPICAKVQSGSYIHVIDSGFASEFVSQSVSQYRNVAFGGKFLLLGLTLVENGDGMNMKLVWKSIGRQKLAFIVAVHILDANGKIVSQADYPQDRGESVIEDGTHWLDTLSISGQKLLHGKAIAIAIHSRDSGMLPIDKGPRDWGGKRLLIDMAVRKICDKR